MKLTAEHDPFVAVPNWIWMHDDLQHADIRVYIAIKHHWNRRTGQCNPSIATIAQVAKVSPDHVRKSSIPRLEAAGALLVKPDLKGGRRSNHYHLQSYPQPLGDDALAVPSDRASFRRARASDPRQARGLSPSKQEELRTRGAADPELEPDGSDSAAPHHYCRDERAFVDTPKVDCPNCQPQEATS